MTKEKAVAKARKEALRKEDGEASFAVGMVPKAETQDKKMPVARPEGLTFGEEERQRVDFVK
jgi:hypothetical protein